MAPHILLPQIPCAKGKGQRVLELLSPMLKYSQNEKENCMQPGRQYSRERITNRADSYFFFQGEDNEDLIWGIEEYRQKDDLYEQHLKSSEFATFAGALKEESLVGGEISMKNFEPQSGFIAREKNYSGTGNFIWVAQLTCASSKARDEILAKAKSLAKYVYDNESKTLSYLFLKSLDDDKDMAVFEIYENKAALTDIHHKSEEFLSFGKYIRENNLVTARSSQGFKAIGQGYLAKDGQGASFR